MRLKEMPRGIDLIAAEMIRGNPTVPVGIVDISSRLVVHAERPFVRAERTPKRTAERETKRDKLYPGVVR